MSTIGIIKLIELRNCYDKYTQCCQGYADTPFQQERWMLHYDILTTLIDDERLDEESNDPTIFNQRFVMLEGLSKEIALQYQNHYLKLHGQQPLTNATADAIDKKNGDLIELKVTWIPETGTTEYLEKSKKETQDTGMILVIADTNKCDIYQPVKTVFSKGLDLARIILLRRKELMEEYNMSDNSVLQRISIKPLPNFLKQMSSNLNLKDQEFFDVSKAKYKGKTRNEWYEVMMKAERNSKKTKRTLEKGKGMLEEGEPSSKKSKVSLEETLTQAVKQAQNAQEKEKSEKMLEITTEMQRRKNLSKYMEKEYEEAKICYENSLIPCANKKASIVIRPLNFKGKDFLEYMSKEKLLETIQNLDDKAEEEGLYLKWKALVLPLNQLYWFEDMDVNEFSVNNEFEVPIHLSKDGANDWLGFQGLLEELAQRPKDILNLSKKNLSKVLSEGGRGKNILDLFGVGWKEFKQIGLVEPEGLDYDFENKPEKGTEGFPYWFNKVKNGFTETFNKNWIVMPTLARRETMTEHPIDNWSEKIVNNLMSNLITKNCMFYCSIVENIYNRLGGMLSSQEGVHVREKKDGKKQYNNLRIQVNMLETICYEPSDGDLNKKRISVGIVFRGPTHARQPTDSTNLIILSFFKPELISDCDNFNLLKRMHPNYSFGYCKIRDIKIGYGIRRFAYKRIDPSYFSFITNALFEPINSLGDEVFKELSNKGYYDVDIEDYYNPDAIKVLSYNFSENVIVGVNMTNFDEGLMPFVRYEFLNSQARLSEEGNFNLDYESYLDKLSTEYKRAGITKYLLKKAIF